MPPGVEEKVDCIVHHVVDGSKHLVFKIRGTERCVGEIRFSGDDRYLLSISELFGSWAHIHRGKLALPSTVHLNG